jgi:hypothetical protein
MRCRSGVIVWACAIETSCGLPKPGDPDRRRTIVYGLKLFSKTPRQG